MKPTPEQIEKLPVWAREHIKDLQREREVSLRALNQFQDEQTESPFSFFKTPCTGEESGPVLKRAFIQTQSIEVNWRGVQLTISTGCQTHGRGIKLQWGDESKHAEMALIPESHQSARICAPHDMYPYPA